MHPLRWLGQRDRDFAALRRAGRTAIVMPALFALGDKVIGDAALATFAAFGAFAMLLLVDFGGPMVQRLQAQAALVVVGGVFVCLGTLASQTAWLAASAMAVAGFGVIFAGAVSSVLAGAATALLLAFILPVSLAAPASSVPDRLAGWGMAGGVALAAVALLWPAPARDPLRGAVITACRALAALLRSEAAYLLSGEDRQFALDRDHAAGQANHAVTALHRAFLATPYRPTGLSTAARTIVRLVDEVNWLNTIAVQSGPRGEGAVVSRPACAVKVATAAVLERGADLLDVTGGNSDDMHAALAELAGALTRMEDSATADLPVWPAPRGTSPVAAGEPVSEFITSLDPTFRAQELGFAVSLIARNIDLTAAAERRSWRERLLGRQPEGLSGTLSAAQERAAAQVEPHSVWLQNSVRGAAVLVAIGTNTTLLWFLLPPAVLLAGVAPAAISFAGGQAAFTLTLVILFNIIQPAGWRIGLLRVEDIALGCAVSLVVGVLFWPRGAGPVLREALAEAYTDSARYLASAVSFGMSRCDASLPAPAAPADDAFRAAAAARRLDAAFRTYLAERGAKPIPLAEVTSLVTGVAGLRLAADAVLDLWQRGDGKAGGDRTAARREILDTTERVTSWYDDLALNLINQRELREPLAHDKIADGRLIEAVRHDLRGDDGKASATAVRMIWTGDHIDAVRRLQTVIIPAARAAAGQRTRGPLAKSLPWRFPRPPRRTS